MCREAAWAELTVEVTFVTDSRSEARGKKDSRIAVDKNVLWAHSYFIEKECQMMKKMTEDEKFMRAAIAQAKKAQALDEVPIGCVIVCEGKIIARGYNRRNTDKNTLSHAELNAIRKASKKLGDWRLEGCTIYITLEPCQMCAGAIVQARITRAVIGSMNAKAGCAGSILNILEMPQFNHQVDVTRGVLGDECSRMLSDFFRELRIKKKAFSNP